MSEGLDRLKAALADRYDIQRELGRGGHATVYLAHDLKHRRQVAIKVLLPELSSAVASERFLREIEIAARLSHPHILPLHDSGEADGFLYYVMPFVEGESLRERLTRERQLPLEEALGIAREVADALEYAHSAGVLHRDIKPENILLQAGHAVVADFGIARAVDIAGGDKLTKTGIVVGTAGYMSPEQATAEKEVDARSDIYSLACVLYEMLVGEPPYTGPTPQAIIARQVVEAASPVSTVRDVPESVDQAVRRALARTPADRFATAAELRAALAAADAMAPRRRSLRSRLRSPVVWLVGLVALALVGGAVVLYPSPAIPFDDRDWILIAQLQNETGDSVFDGSLNTALTVGLQQSSHINVVPRSRVGETLQRMERDAEEPLSEAEWREVAQRENVRVLIVPSIARVDSVYLLTIRAVDPATGSDLKSRSARAAGKAAVLASLDELARQLRRDLGESRLALARGRVRLDLATTSSLEALKLYTRARLAFNSNNLDESVLLYQEAIALDSSFAMAHTGLGLYYLWVGERARGEEHLAKALAAADRLTDRERLSIEADADLFRQDFDEAISAYKVYLDRFPDDIDAWVNLGNAYLRVGRLEEAIATLTRGLQLDSTDAGLYINIATAHNSLGEHDAALPYYLRAFELEPQSRLFSNLNHEFGFNYVGMGDVESAEKTFTDMLAGSDEQRAGGQRSLGLLRMYTGRYHDAIDRLTQALILHRALGYSTSEARDRLYLAAAYAAIGDAADARSEIAAVHKIGRTDDLGPWWLMLLGKREARSGMLGEAKETLDTLEARIDEDRRFDKVARHTLSGEVALAEGRFAEATQELGTASALNERGGMALESLAYAHLRAGDLEAARSEYERLIQLSPLGEEAQEQWFDAHLQLGRIHELRGDTAKATEYYRRLLELWKDGDDDLVALKAARERLRALAESD